MVIFTDTLTFCTFSFLFNMWKKSASVKVNEVEQ